MKITFPLDEDQQREMGLAISELFEFCTKIQEKEAVKIAFIVFFSFDGKFRESK